MISEEQKEAKRQLKAIDCLANRLNDWEKKFVINMIDNWKQDFTPKQIQTIHIIADKHNIL